MTQVEAEQVLRVQPELLVQRQVKVQAFTDGFDLLLAGVVTRHQRRRVAGANVQQHEDHDQHREHDRNDRKQSLGDQAQHGLAVIR